ncbi:MAG: co-chaperone GroES [Armatimonadetes bacterium]|nr:co-chaperone GroES [Armatimonadota bacterium]
MLKPLDNRIVVKPIEMKEATHGGIVLPDTARERPQEGEIVGVGPGKILKNGTRVPMDLSPGDRVIYSKYGGIEIKIGDDEYVILSEDDLLAVVE